MLEEDTPHQLLAFTLMCTHMHKYSCTCVCTKEHVHIPKIKTLLVYHYCVSKIATLQQINQCLLVDYTHQAVSLKDRGKSYAHILIRLRIHRRWPYGGLEDSFTL